MKKRILRALFAIVMVVGLLPGFTLTASAEDAIGYIANIGIVAADTAEDAKQQLTNTGHTVIDRDLNEGANGKRIYMGYTRTMNADEAIYGLQIFYGQAADRDSHNGFRVIGTGDETNTAGGGKVNLNAGAGGGELYLAVTRDPEYHKVPLVDIQITYSDLPPDSYYRVQCIGGSDEVHLNLNVTGGSAIYLHQQYAQPFYERLQLYYLSASGNREYIAKGRTVYLYADTFTWDDQPKEVTYGGQAYQFAGWRENLNPGPVTANKATATYENPERTYYAVYSRNLKLSFDANGGTGGPATQTQMQYLYVQDLVTKTESKTFTISNEKPTHADSGKEFYGWSTNSDGTGNTYFPGDTLTLTKDTTLYAVWTVSAADCTVTLDEGDSYLETGSPLTPAVTVKNGNTVLTEGTNYSVQYTQNLSPGTAKVTVMLKAPYEGQLVTWFHIANITFRTEPGWISPPSDGQSKTVTLKAAVDGAEVEGATYQLKENYSGVTLEGSTLTVSSGFEGHISITGTYQNFSEDFSILVRRQELPSATLSSTITTFNGMEQKPVVVGFIDSSDLTEGEDYTVTYLRNGVETSDLTNVGSIDVLVTGINDYSGTEEKYYSIQQVHIVDVAKSGYTAEVNYNGQPQKPEFTLLIEDTGYVLQEGTDYTVSYQRDGVETNDFTSIGYIRVHVTGQGNFEGEDVLHYFILENDITEDIYITAENVIYDGEDHKPTVSVMQGGKPLTENTDYTVSYQRDEEDTVDFKNVGTVTVTVTGTGSCTGNKTVSYTISPKELTDSDVTVSGNTVWNGSEQKPTVTVFGVPASDYTVTYTREGEETTDFTGCGTITITVAGANSNCTGTVTKAYVIGHVADMRCCEASFALKYQADENSEIEYTNDLSYLSQSGTVTLLKDITLSQNITVNNLKLVMNGRSVTIASNKQIIINAENGSLTVDASAGGSFASTGSTYFHALIHVSNGKLTVIGNPVFDGVTGIQSSLENAIDLSEYTGEGLLIFSYIGNNMPVTATLGSGYKIISWTQDGGDGSDLADNAIPFMQIGKVVKIHAHVWNYTVSGNTITATCGAAGCTLPEGKCTAIVEVFDNMVYNPNGTGCPVVYSAIGWEADSIRVVNNGFTDVDGVLKGSAAIEINGTRYGEFPYTIKPAANAFTTKPAAVEDLEYTGSAQALVTEGVAKGGTVQYKLPDGEWSNSVPAMTEVGTYTVFYRVVGNAYYTDIAEDAVSVTISKAAAPDIVWPTASGLNYGQKLSESALTGEDENGTFAWQDGNTVPTVTNNGYAVVYTPKDTDNYDYSGVELTKTISVTVSKVSATVTAAPTPKTLTYTGEALSLIDGGEATGGEMQYSTDNQNWSITIPKGTDAGKYTVYYKVVGDANHSDTAVDSIEVTIAKADRTAPTLTKEDETLLGQKNGAISGVTDKMEYATEIDGNYTAVTGTVLENLAAGTYYVRYRADNNHNASPDAVLTIAAGKPISVNYHVGSQTVSDMPGDLRGLSYGTKLSNSPVLMSENHDFAFEGWYKDEALETPWNFATDTLAAETVNLYAKWKQVYFTVTASIVDHEGKEYHGKVEVDLVRGNQLIDSIIGTSGHFTFSKHVEAGLYNLVAIYEDQAGEHTKTELIMVDHDESYTLVLPEPGVNSHLEIAKNENTPDVMVGGLDDEAASVKAAEEQSAEGGAVKDISVNMGVKGKQESEIDTVVVNRIEAIVSTGSSDKVLKYLDINVNKTVVRENSTTDTPITETATVIEIVIPFRFSGRTGIQIIRHHGNAAEALTKNQTKADGTFYLDEENGYIHIFTKKFSTYAIAYTDDSNETVTPPEAKTNLIYNGTAQALITAGTATGGEMLYSFDQVNWSDAIPTATNAGTYTVYYKVGDSVDSITVGVAKKALVITADDKSVCIGKEQPALTYTVEGLVNGETLAANPTLTTDAVMATAGDYTVTASGADVGNNYTVTYQNGTLTVKNHTPGASATHTRAQTCTECGYEITPARGHRYSSDWESNETHHWHECSCGAKKGRVTHTPGAEATHTDAQTCTECGYVIQEALGHDYGTEWKSDATHHWHECSCGEKADVTAHTPGAEATATTDQTCTVCGYVLAERTGEETTVTTREPEVTTREPEVTTREPEVTTREPEVTTREPEVTTRESEVTTREPEVTTREPEVTTREPEVTTREPEVTTREPEVTTTEPEVTTTEPEVTTTEPEVTTREPEVTTREPEVTTREPEVTTREPEVTTTEPEVTTTATETTPVTEPTPGVEPSEPTEPTHSPLVWIIPVVLLLLGVGFILVYWFVIKKH